jgi:hypothetical protein
MAHKMYFTCSCHKEEIKCIKTGFTFQHNGVERHGDLFLCRKCKTMNIAGIAPGFGGLGKQDIALFTGDVAKDANEHYAQSLSGGLLELSDLDVEYIGIRYAKELSDYQIKEDLKAA